jgi:ADP-heptose:LPS heptosyltransferase
MRILVLRGGALGDFLVTLPALRALRQRWPSAVIELAGNATAAQLGIEAGDLNAVHSQHEARWAQLYGPAPLARDFESWLDGFDWIISFWPDLEGDLTRHFTHRGERFVARGSAIVAHPAAAHFCAALRALGVLATHYMVQLAFLDKTEFEASQRLARIGKFIAVHPGSGSPKKNWPYHRWRDLVTQLACPVLLISGEADPLPAALAELPLVHRAHQWPLPVLGAALARARLYIGHDSGISHLAATVGTPSLLLFGPTDSKVWAPPSDRVEIVQGNGDMDTITLSAVHARAVDRLRSIAPDRT